MPVGGVPVATSWDSAAGASVAGTRAAGASAAGLPVAWPSAAGGVGGTTPDSARPGRPGRAGAVPTDVVAPDHGAAHGLSLGLLHRRRGRRDGASPCPDEARASPAAYAGSTILLTIDACLPAAAGHRRSVRFLQCGQITFGIEPVFPFLVEDGSETFLDGEVLEPGPAGLGARHLAGELLVGE